MKVFILPFFFAGVSFATLNSAQLDAVIAESKPFKKDCLDVKKIKEVKDLHVFNKTSEHLDKALISAALSKQFGLKTNSKSAKTLSASLTDSSVESNLAKLSRYTWTFTLRDGGKEVCKNTYFHEITQAK